MFKIAYVPIFGSKPLIRPYTGFPSKYKREDHGSMNHQLASDQNSGYILVCV